MTDKEKELYMKFCKYDKEPKEVILNLLEEMEKKDKIIDEMANNILKFRADTILPTNIEGIKQYFERKIVT